MGRSLESLWNPGDTLVVLFVVKPSLAPTGLCEHIIPLEALITPVLPVRSLHLLAEHCGGQALSTASPRSSREGAGAVNNESYR